MKVNDVVTLLMGGAPMSPGIVVRVVTEEDDLRRATVDVLSARTVVGGPTNPHVFLDVPHFTEGQSVSWAAPVAGEFSQLTQEPATHDPAADSTDSPAGDPPPFDPLIGGVVDGAQVSTQLHE